MIGTALVIGWGLATAAEPDAPATTEAAPAEAAPAEVPVDADVPVVVKLVDPGRGARRPLRIAPRRGDVWQMQIRRKTALTSRLDEDPVESQATPEAIDTLRVEIGDTLVAHVADADLEGASPAGLAALHDDLAQATAVALTAPLDPTQRHPVRLAVLPDEIGQFAAEVLGDVGFALATTTVPLPDESVGVGAAWSWSRDAVEQGAVMVERFEARLVERRGRRITVALTMTASPKDVVRLEDAETVEVELGAKGKVWLDLRRPLARAADLTLTGSLTTTWHEGDAAHRGENTFEATLTIATREDGS